MDSRPIGVFDSGVGGLTAVRELHRLLPRENIVYFGDTARVPYGSRSRETLHMYASQIVSYLTGLDIKALVVACGTISTNLAEVELVRDMPCATVLEPSVCAALDQTENGRVAVIATAAAIRTGVFGERARAHRPDVAMFEQACPLLVPIIENGLTDFDNQIARLTLEMYLNPVLEFGADTLILGCTHYPLLADIIRDMTGGRLSLIDAGASAARQMKTILEENDLCAKREAGSSTYYVTDAVQGFASVAERFLSANIEPQTHHVNLESIERLI